MISITLNIEGKRFGSEAPVLSTLKARVKPGRITAIVGPSGCGKSTLLNMIAGLESSGKGEIIFSGVSGDEPKVGYIFQTPRLMPWLTAKENLELICGTDNPAIQETLDAMGIIDKLDTYPSQLSGGMQRRVSIARAFVYHPDLLLLDEPFTSLDVPTAELLRKQLIDLWQHQQSTMMFVTHDLREAVSLADEVWFLSRPPTTVIHRMEIDQPSGRWLGRDDGRKRIDDVVANLFSVHPQILSGELDAGA
ncbi:ABC transporter ATP-binding protein [Grimontia marina]|uniref:Aliphatic sulfonates import ATP-binding protein SsuB n=1 Tax=Grimontia marina TaxID=646534 RepID=A0A128FH80_9GAMM|nr:ATP-binding cassette domain-containing protein [Grimontia marina]CZF85855.1 Aliphatic sulfonates import ATP-binding protein SsuB [Grimontia marina]